MAQFLRFANVLTEVVTYVICDFINRNIFSYPKNIESMDSLFTVVESELLKQAGLEKAQRGSSSTIQNKVCFEIL